VHAGFRAQQTKRVFALNLDGRTLDAGRIAYLKDAFWADKPARLMQSLLVETVSAKSDKMVLHDADVGGKAARLLAGSLIEFGIDASSNEAVVIYDAVKIIRGNATEKRRFEARKPLAAIEAVPAGAALNSAANDVAVQIADWVN
jgi:cholesterol transport system auxiliary component